MTTTTARQWRRPCDRVPEHPYARMAAGLRRILDQACYPELRVTIGAELRVYATACAILEAKLAGLAAEATKER